MLVGNKLDICEKNQLERKVSCDRAGDFARSNEMLFMETSAFTDINVRDVFETLDQEIYNVKSREDSSGMRQGVKKLVHHDPSMEEKSSCGCM